VFVTGRVRPADTERTVILQRAYDDAVWRDIESTTTSVPDGDYALRVPTNRAGGFRYRLFLPATDTATEGTTRPMRLEVNLRRTEMPSNLSAQRVRADGEVFLAGGLTPNFHGRRVVLERRVMRKWLPVSKPQTVRPGERFRFQVPTTFYSNLAYRVVAVENRYAEAWHSDLHGLKVVPSYKPAGTKFNHDLIVPERVRWNPCQPIHYKVNARLGGRGALADVREAVRRIERATGLRFVHAGPSRKIPQFDGSDRWFAPRLDVLIAWARPRQSAGLSEGENRVGVGGPWYLRRGFEDVRGRAHGAILKGAAAINANIDLDPGFGAGYTRGDVVLHELAHAVGLGHAKRPNQMMYPSIRPGPVRFGAGDLRGLERLGATWGCVYPREEQRARPQTWMISTSASSASTAKSSS